MQQELTIMIELQRLDNLIADAQEKLDNIPEYLETVRNEYTQVTADFEAIDGTYGSGDSEYNKISADYEEHKALLEKANKKLPEVKNNKEYEAVLKEVDTLKKNISEAEIKLVQLSETNDAQKKQYEELKGKKAELEKIVAEKEAQKNEEDSELAGKLKKYLAERDKVSKGLKKSILTKYDRIRNARNNLAIVRVEDETCTGCYIKVPPQLYVEIIKDTSLKECPNCQRFLYFKKDEEEQGE